MYTAKLFFYYYYFICFLLFVVVVIVSHYQYEIIHILIWSLDSRFYGNKRCFKSNRR